MFIGHGGIIRKTLEERSGAHIHMDSSTGEIEVDLREPDDPLMGMKLQNVIRAISRGFSPEHAFVLFDDDYFFEIIDIRDFVGKSRNAVNRMRGRLIGKEGKTRKIMEETSEAYISVYGHSVSLIGQDLNVVYARTAIEMILNGAEHSSVYSFLEKKRAELKMYRYGFD